MNLLKCNFVLLALLMAYQTALSQSFLLVKDDKIKSIVPADAVIEKIGDGFQFTEGPAWSPKGFLLFTDIPANRISHIVERAGYPDVHLNFFKWILDDNRYVAIA